MVDRQHVTQSQPTLCAADSEKTIGLSRITTAPAAIRSSDEKQASSDWRQKINQSPLFPAVLLVAAGCGVAFQSGMNATMRDVGGRSFSAVMNFAVGFSAGILIFILDLLVIRTSPPKVERLKQAPWYSWLGGAFGTYYIIINILIIPKLGAGTVLSVFVCAQVIMACIMDHFGITGIAKRRYSIYRILASLGLIGCVAVITLF